MVVASWIIALVWIFGVGIPVAKILGRLGYSKVFVVLAFIPLVNIIGLWILANATWPKLPGNEG